MKERLPIWFQALAIALLSGIFVGTHGWVSRQKQTTLKVHYGIEIAANPTLDMYMPVAILYLGVRFFWRFAHLRGKGTPVEAIFCWLVFVFLFPALFAIALLPFSPASQRIREANVTASADPVEGSAARPNRGRHL